MSYDKSNNNFGIPEGLVSKRRAELIETKWFGYGAAPATDAPPVALTKQELQTPLIHLTKSRPAITHRPPSRKSKSLMHEFFTENLKSQNELVPADTLIKSLNKVIIDAKCDYYNHHTYGTKARCTSGWLSSWRHGASGQSKAQDILLKTQEIDSIDSLLQQMDLFFLDSQTRYNNHSFTSYLLDELNKMLTSFSLPGCKPKDGVIYDKNSWLVIFAQLQKLAPVNGQDNGNTM